MCTLRCAVAGPRRGRFGKMVLCRVFDAVTSVCVWGLPWLSWTNGSKLECAMPSRVLVRSGFVVAVACVVSMCQRRWVSVDCVREAVDTPYAMEDARPVAHPLCYVVAMNEPGVFRDVTRRYTRRWLVACKLRDKSGTGAGASDAGGASGRTAAATAARSKWRGWWDTAMAAQHGLGPWRFPLEQPSFARPGLCGSRYVVPLWYRDDGAECGGQPPGRGDGGMVDLTGGGGGDGVIDLCDDEDVEAVVPPRSAQGRALPQQAEHDDSGGEEERELAASAQCEVLPTSLSAFKAHPRSVSRAVVADSRVVDTTAMHCERPLIDICGYSVACGLLSYTCRYCLKQQLGTCT